MTDRSRQRKPVVGQAEIDTYQRDGALCLRNLLRPHEIELLRAGVEQNLRSPSPRAKIASRPDDPGYFIEDFCCWQQNEYYRRVIFDSALGKTAARLMRSHTARLYHDHMLTKEPGTRQRTPWHQDQPYFNVAGSQNISFWIPIDPVSRASTLEFVAGSHHGPWLMPRSFMDSQARWFPEGALADLPDIESDRSRYEILGWALQPGDVVCFHMLTLHAAGGVTGEQRRRVVSIRFLGDDITHALRPWKTSPEFPGLAEELPDGAPMHHPSMPIIWQEQGC